MPELSLVLDDQPAGDGGKSGKAALEKQAGMDLRITKPRNRSGWRKIWTIPSGAGTRRHIPAAAAKKARPINHRKTRSPADEAGRRTGRGCPGPGAGRGGRLHPAFNKMGFIETEKRDEIYMALRGILDACRMALLQKDALMEKFEQLRDFLKGVSH